MELPSMQQTILIGRLLVQKHSSPDVKVFHLDLWEKRLDFVIFHDAFPEGGIPHECSHLVDFSERITVIIDHVGRSYRSMLREITKATIMVFQSEDEDSGYSSDGF